jgi:hypothetical protein
MNGKDVLLSFILSICFLHGSSQIYLNNPSFEEEPSDATTPMGWFACTEGTTPDILPGFWGVYNEASDGKTYLGIITRANNTWESIGQRVSSYFKKNDCYEFSLDLAKAENYVGYNQEIRLRIYIGDHKCAVDQLIFESPFIQNTDWKTHLVQFTPEEHYNYIRFEAFYGKGRSGIKGNVLIDNISPILMCSKT